MAARLPQVLASSVLVLLVAALAGCGKSANNAPPQGSAPPPPEVGVVTVSTGDVGLVTPDGFIKITGRVSRFAKIAGEMVPLERLEEELHDAIGGGDRVLAVAAVPDEKRGERLVVLYLPELEGRVSGLLESLAGRGLPNLWVPDLRDAFRVEALPLLGSGKLDLKRVGEVAKQLADAS